MHEPKVVGKYNEKNIELIKKYFYVKNQSNLQT